MVTTSTQHARQTRQLFAVAGIAALALTACSTGSGTGASTDSATENSSSESEAATATTPTSLTVGLSYVPDIQFAPFYVAEDLGFYEEAGLDVTLRHHGAEEGIFTALEQGAEDVVVASGDEVLGQAAAGSDVVQIATLYATSPVALIAPEEAGITTAADLEGLTIGTPGEYGSTYLGLLTLLEEAGLGTDDVTIQSIGYTQTTALLTDQVDAVMGFSNGDGVRIAAAGTPVTVLEPPSLVSVGVATTGEEIESEAEALTAFIEASVRGAQAAAEDPEGTVEIASGYISGMTADAREDALAVLEATIPLWSDGAETDLEVWQAMGEAMVGAGIIEEIPEGAVTNDLASGAGR